MTPIPMVAPVLASRAYKRRAKESEVSVQLVIRARTTYLSDYKRSSLPPALTSEMASGTIPKTTKQWKVTGYDGLESLQFMEEPVPELGDDQVLVKSTLIVLIEGDQLLTTMFSSRRVLKCRLLQE